MSERQGYGIKITRRDGTSFLASAGTGILPAVYTLAQRKHAVVFKNKLKENGIENAKVVRVTFSDVQIDNEERKEVINMACKPMPKGGKKGGCKGGCKGK
jgi:hypothetical protein